MQRSTARRIRRAVLIALAAVFGVYLLFLVVVNSLLWSGAIASWASRSDEDVTVQLDHGFAWVLWPTRVHVDDFHLALDSHSFQLKLDIEQGMLDVALWELVLKNFHAEELEAHGVKAVVRIKHAPDSPAMDRMDAYGAIEGVPPPIRFDPEPPPKPRDQKLLVDLDNVLADVEQLWINEFRLDMDGQITGSLFSIGDYETRVEKARLDIQDGVLVVDEQQRAEDLKGHVSMRLQPYLPMQEKKALPDLTLEAVLSAQLLELGFVDDYLPAGVPVSISGGQGPLDLDATLDRGALTAGSYLGYETDALVVTSKGLRGRTALDLQGAVLARPSTRHGRATEVETTLTDAELRPASATGKKDPAATLERARARVVLGGASIDEPWPVVASAGVIEDLQIDDVSIVREVSQSAPVRSGSLSMQAAWHTKGDGRVIGQASAKSKGLTLKSGKSTASFSAQAETNLSYRFDTKTLELDDVTGKIEGLDLNTPHGDSQDSWVRLQRGRVRWQIPDKQMRARLRGELEDLRPVLAYAKNAGDLINGMPDLDLADPVNWQIEYLRDGDKKLLQLENIERALLDVRGKLALSGKTRGALLFDSIDLGVAIEPGQTNFEMLADEAWLQKQTQDLPEVSPTFSDPPSEPDAGGAADEHETQPDAQEPG